MPSQIQNAFEPIKHFFQVLTIGLIPVMGIALLAGRWLTNPDMNRRERNIKNRLIFTILLGLWTWFCVHTYL